MASDQELPPPDQVNDPLTSSSPWLVRAAVVLALVMVIVPIASVWWRWMHVQFPNAALFIHGDATSDGAEVVVSRDNGDTIFRDRLTSEKQYQLVVLVEHGVYNVIARRDEKVLVRERLYVANGGGMLLQVIPPGATRPATNPSTQPTAAPSESPAQ